MATVLVVDDDSQFCDLMCRRAQRLGHRALAAATLGEGLRAAAADLPEVVVLDVRLPDGSGLGAIRQVKELPSQPEVIIVTGAADPDGAELAIRSGAWDYLQKGCSVEEFLLPLKHALEYRREKLAAASARALDLKGIVGSSEAIRACYDGVARAAASRAPVLITGETGTGKELFARAIHDNGARRGEPFVVVDCAALPAHLVEATLFGHVRGAFTGALADQSGLIRQAHGGTLFLDEVGELPPPVQPAFLRVLQEHRYRPVGGQREAASDFRVVAATNRDLGQRVAAGRFREDLLFRLRSLVIHLPPLRERGDDVQEIAQRLVRELCADADTVKGISREFFTALAAYSWPGNVRELARAVEHAVAASSGQEVLLPRHLPTEIRVAAARRSVAETAPVEEPAACAAELLRSAAVYPSLKQFRHEATGLYLEQLMVRAGGKIAKACELSGLSRTRLYELLRSHGLPTPERTRR